MDTSLSDYLGVCSTITSFDVECMSWGIETN